MKRPIAFVVLFAVSALVFVQTIALTRWTIAYLQVRTPTLSPLDLLFTAPNSNGEYRQIYPASDFQSFPRWD